MRRLSIQLLTTFCLLFLSLYSQAQNLASCLDSVRGYLRCGRPDTSKAWLLLRLAQLPACPPDTLVANGQYWIAYTQRANTRAGLPEACYTEGLGLYRKGRNTDALNVLYRAAAEWEKSGHSPLQLARTDELIAAILKIPGRYADALGYYRMAYRLKKGVGEEPTLLSTYNGLGTTFRALGQYDSAVFYLDRALPLTAAKPLIAAQINNNLGNIYWSQQHWPQADACYHKALSQFQELRDSAGMAEAYFNLGAVATRQSRYPAAAGFYRASLSTAGNQSLDHLEWIYRHLADAQAHTGQYAQAYRSVLLYDSVRDTGLSLSVQRSIADLKEKYESAKKEQALTLEQARTARLSLINTNQVRLIAILGAVTVLLLGMGYVIIRNVRRRQLLATELAALRESEKQQLIREQQLKSDIARLEGRETERQRISRDLHDRLGGTLSSVRMFMRSNRRVPAAGDDQYSRIDRLLEEAITDVRNISHDLSTGIVQKYGLTEALCELALTAEADGAMNVTFHHDNIGLFMGEAAVETYYIVKELVTNALRHSRASWLSICLTGEKQYICLTVEDNGVGFEPGAGRKGIGLANIEIRAAKIRAELSIDSRPGNGTCCTLMIPQKLHPHV